VSAEMYHESAKFEKQFKYAEKKKIPHIVILGSKELQEHTCTVKTLTSSEQTTMQQTDLIHFNF
jgi:histidyl-tRNA synthetase